MSMGMSPGKKAQPTAKWARTMTKWLVTYSRRTGAKWNVARSWLVNTSLLIRVTDPGLRARLTPAVSIDYSFER